MGSHQTNLSFRTASLCPSQAHTTANARQIPPPVPSIRWCLLRDLAKSTTVSLLPKYPLFISFFYLFCIIFIFPIFSLMKVALVCLPRGKETLRLQRRQPLSVRGHPHRRCLRQCDLRLHPQNRLCHQWQQRGSIPWMVCGQGELSKRQHCEELHQLRLPHRCIHLPTRRERRPPLPRPRR